MEHDDEKKAIEHAAAKRFLEFYNRKYKSSYSITSLEDAPDIRCSDKEGNLLNLEITLTQDRPGDIQAALGRSDSRSLESLRQSLKENPPGSASCLQGNVLDSLLRSIKAKLNKHYGKNVALVVVSSSGVPWSWDRLTDELSRKLSSSRNPFDRGVWLVTRDGSECYQLIPPSRGRPQNEFEGGTQS
jgi:hypothetical protein